MQAGGFRVYPAPSSLAALVPGMPAEGVDLLSKFLQYNPLKRISAAAAMEHPVRRLCVCVWVCVCGDGRSGKAPAFCDVCRGFNPTCCVVLATRPQMWPVFCRLTRSNSCGWANRLCSQCKQQLNDCRRGVHQPRCTAQVSLPRPIYVISCPSFYLWWCRVRALWQAWCVRLGFTRCACFPPENRKAAHFWF